MAEYGVMRDSASGKFLLHLDGEPIADFIPALTESEITTIMTAIDSATADNILHAGDDASGGDFGAMVDPTNGVEYLHYKGEAVAKFRPGRNLATVQSDVTAIAAGDNTNLLDVGVPFTAAEGLTYGKVTGFSATDFYSLTGDGPTLDGEATLLVLFTKESETDAVEELEIGRFTSATRGWRVLLRDGTEMRTTVNAVNGTPANQTETNTIAAVTTSAINRFYAVIDGDTDQLLETFLNGALQSAAPALVGYTPPTTEDFILGKINTGAAPEEWGIVALAVADVALTEAEIATWDAQVAADEGYDPPRGTLSYLLEAKDAGATWVPSTGTGTLAEQGTVTVDADITPTWE